MRHLPLLLLAGCAGGQFTTDSGQLAISDDEQVDIEGARFLAGSELCPTLKIQHGDELPEGEYVATDCFAQSFEGPVGQAGECLQFTEPGTVDWTFTPQECPGNAYGYTPAPDHVAIEVVAAENVEGSLPMRLEELVESLVEDNPAVRLDGGEDWKLADDEPLRLVANQRFAVSPMLRTADGAVAWREGELNAETGVVTFPLETKGAWDLVANEGASSALTLAVDGGEFEVGTVEGVPESAVASIEIAVLYVDAEDGISMPYGARAVLRDQDGNLVFGAPVEWRHSALRLMTGPDAGLPGADYVMFADECSDPGTTFGEQRATLRASVGLVSDVVELVWTPRLEAAPEEGWTKHEDCQPPTVCGCSSGGSAPAGLLVVGLAALGLRRRR